jgi:hypothetical protein
MPKQRGYQTIRAHYPPLAGGKLTVAVARIDGGKPRARWTRDDAVRGPPISVRVISGALPTEGVRHPPRSPAVDEGTVGVGVEKIGREVGIKPSDIGFIHGTDVVAIELLQSRVVLSGLGHHVHRESSKMGIAKSSGVSPCATSAHLGQIAHH